MEAATVPAELRHFAELPPEAQRGAIQRLAARGYTDTSIAAATRLSVEQVRRVLGEARAEAADAAARASVVRLYSRGFDRPNIAAAARVSPDFVDQVLAEELVGVPQVQE